MTTEPMPVSIPKPLMLTIAAIVLGIVLQPIVGVDVIYDIVAFIFVCSKWRNYNAATQQIGNGRQPAITDDIEYINKGIEAYNAGVRAYKQENWTVALRSFNLAAAHKQPQAMNYLGLMYREGEGTAKNYDVSLSWFKDAIENGEECAALNLVNLGIYYLKGVDTPVDPKKAAEVMSIAASFGIATAQYNLGLFYRKGCGVPQNVLKARHWYALAAAQGDEDAKRALAEMDAAERQQDSGDSNSSDGRMSRAAALEILDLKEGASTADIKAAYTRLMQHVHPDKGGSNFFARQLNEARDTLLK